MASTNPARGMRDFLPTDVRKRNYVIGIIKEVYESYGFEPLETPAVENLETLTGKYGEEGNQLIFKILKRGEKLDLENASTESDVSDLALRYDLTVPLARVVANNKNELPKFFKRYQIQPVWRADRPARGRFREFYQCDVDVIGSESMVVEAEIISAVSSILLRLGFADFTLFVNHREILNEILAAAKLPKDKHNAALIALDKLGKIGRKGVELELAEHGINSEQIEAFLSPMDESCNLVDSRSDLDNRELNLALLSLISNYIGDNVPPLGQLRRLFELLPYRSKVRFDVALARGLSYYTGAIMEISVPDLAGSLGGGGRYDGLIGMFGKEQIPACGFSLGLERILVVMDERGMFPPEIAASSPADVMVTLASEEAASASLKLASELRTAGLRVTLYPEADKLGKQIKYADSIKVPWVCVLGESEIADGTVTVKNMKSGEQKSIARAEISKEVFSE